MLSALLQRNATDNTDTTMSGNDILYRDTASNTELRFGSILTGDSSRQRILFGDVGIDTLTAEVWPTASTAALAMTF